MLGFTARMYTIDKNVVMPATTSVLTFVPCSAGMRVEALLFLPGMAFNMSVAVLVGNSLGAGKPAQAKRVGLNMVWVASLMMSVVLFR